MLFRLKTNMLTLASTSLFWIYQLHYFSKHPFWLWTRRELNSMPALEGHYLLYNWAMSVKEREEVHSWTVYLKAMAFRIYIVPLKEENQNDQIGRFKKTLEITDTVSFARQNCTKTTWDCFKVVYLSLVVFCFILVRICSFLISKLFYTSTIT